MRKNEKGKNSKIQTPIFRNMLEIFPSYWLTTIQLIVSKHAEPSPLQSLTLYLFTYF